ncbi:MAG: HTH domain-containing protein [Deltaproteobacteria bacterium]|jgi:predicted HTH transcriptional regulator|nr:HTH domain-containing protein [Deltaproteobacteria bacterium]
MTKTCLTTTDDVVVNVVVNVALHASYYEKNPSYYDRRCRSKCRSNVALKPTAVKIVVLLKETPEATADDIAMKLALNRRTVQRRLKSLKGSGIIGRDGSDKIGRWIVK